MTSLNDTVIAVTSRLPDNWLGLRLAILLRRIVTMRLSGDSGLDIERWGLRMRLHPRHNGCEKGLLFTPQMFEVRERAELKAEIKKVSTAGRPFVFIDIGANVGLFSLFVASCAARNAEILAFEPEPENVRRLEFNIDANPGLPIHVFHLRSRTEKESFFSRLIVATEAVRACCERVTALDAPTRFVRNAGHCWMC